LDCLLACYAGIDFALLCFALLALDGLLDEVVLWDVTGYDEGFRMRPID